MGKLEIIFEPFDEPPYGRLYVSHPARYPTFEELLPASQAPGGPMPNLWVLVPKPDHTERMQRNMIDLYVMTPRELLG